MAVLTHSILLDIAVLLLTLVGVAYLYFSRHYSKWEKNGAPFLKPTPFVGNFKDVLTGGKNIGEIFEMAYNAGKGKSVMGVYAFDQPMLVIRDLEIIKSVLVKDFNYFMDRNFAPDKDVDPLIGRNLFAMDGQRWKHLRVKLTPTFTSGKIKRMFMFVDECGKELIKYVDKYTVDGRLEVKDTMARYTTDVIASCVFGIQGNALREKDSEFRRILRRIVEFSIVKGIISVLSFTAPAVLTAFKLKILDDDIVEYIRNTVWSTVEHRKKNNIIRKDFLDLLIQLRETGQVEDESNIGQAASEEQKFELEGDDFVAQAFVFLAAGFETSSTTMGFALYELSLQPEIQTRVREEIHSVVLKNGGEVTYDGIQEMTYLDMVLSETLRKYPVLPFLDRKVIQPYTLPGTNIKLEKGDKVVIPLLGIQYDSKYYPDPLRFDPERFTEENKRLRPNYTYMPFGEGPRVCIGMRIGLLQAKVGLVHFLSTFEVRPCKETHIPMQFDKNSFLMAPKNSLPLTVTRITETR